MRAVDLDDDLGMDLDEDEASLDDSAEEGERSLVNSDSVGEEDEWLVNRLADETMNNDESNAQHLQQDFSISLDSTSN